VLLRLTNSAPGFKELMNVFSISIWVILANPKFAVCSKMYQCMRIGNLAALEAGELLRTRNSKSDQQ